MKYISIISIMILFINCSNKPVALVFPNYFKGDLTIIEDKINYEYYDAAAMENYNEYVYFVKDNVLRVENIEIFDDWEKVDFGLEWCEGVDKIEIEKKVINDKSFKVIFKW